MNKRVYIDRVLSGVALLLWMTVIFGFSAQNGQVSGDVSGNIIIKLAGFFNPDYETLTEIQQTQIVSSWQLVVRKTAHFSEYALLAVLAANALRTYKIKKALWWIIPSVFCLLYAVSDELHQYFVAGRDCRVIDVIIDTAGGMFGTAVFMLFIWLVARHRLKKKKEINRDTQGSTAG